MRILVFILYVLFWGLTNSAHAYDFDIPFQDFVFGQARPISCLTGIKNKHMIYNGVHILPDPDWTIQNAQFTWQASDNSPSKTFTPLNQPLENELIYPAVFLMKQNRQKTTYSVNGSVLACHAQDGCTEVPIQLSLSLSPALALQTPQCFAIVSALANSPKPWPNKIKGQAIATTDTMTHISLQLPKVSDKLSFFTTDRKPFLPQNLQKQDAFISFDIPSSTEKNIQFILQTNTGSYQIILPVMNSTTEIMLPQLSRQQWLQLFVLSLLLSPLLLIWGNHKQKTLQEYKTFDYYVYISIISATIIGMCCSLFPQLNMAFPLSKGLSIALLIATILWAKSSPFLILLALLFLPKPLWNVLTPISSLQKMTFICILGSIWMILFTLQIYYAKKIRDFLDQWREYSPIGVYTVFATPLLLLLGYVIFYL